jgi:hypothetical protein
VELDGTAGTLVADWLPATVNLLELIVLAIAVYESTGAVDELNTTVPPSTTVTGVGAVPKI